MTQILWDASGLVKRYYEEQGSATVRAILAAMPALPMTMTLLGYAEAAAILRRKLNGGLLSRSSFGASRFLLEHEVYQNPDFRLLSVIDADILNGIALTDRHNLNASDAAILAAYVRFARTVAQPCVLVAADGRLLRAGRIEGMTPLNPETLSAADFPAFLAAAL